MKLLELIACFVVLIIDSGLFVSDLREHKDK